MDEQMVEQENSLTFGEIFRLLKKGWVVLVVAVLIGVILATSCLLVLREIIGTTNYETQITFSSASISEDKEYNPSTNVNTLVKSSTLVSKALTNLGYSEESQQELIKKGLIENLSAYAAKEKTDSEGVAYPYVVTISLKKFSNKALSKDQSAALVEELTKQVILELQAQYKKEIAFSEIAALDYTKYNYLQAYEKLDIALKNVDMFEASLDDNTLNYKKNGVTVKSTLAKFDLIKSELNVIKLNLTDGALINATATSSELDYAKDKVTFYTQKEAQLSDRITKYADLLEKTKPDINVMSGTIAAEALQNYYELVAVYNNLQDEYAQVLANKKAWEDIMAAYSGSTTPSTEVQTDFNNLVTLYNTTYDVLKEEIKTYNEDNYASSLVAETNTVETVKDSAISALIIILVDVVVIAVIMIVIVAVEKKKEGKKENIQEKVKE